MKKSLNLSQFKHISALDLKLITLKTQKIHPFTIKCIKFLLTC